ncbi:MAG: hypothetical protein IPJ84_19990 [Bdellovibrionales bacterium]|nr:hypothetical protein [Bdellovibrionales bacterium]
MTLPNHLFDHGERITRSGAFVRALVFGLLVLSLQSISSVSFALPSALPPSDDPYKASLMYAFLAGSDANQHREKLSLFPERKSIPVLGERTDFTFSFYPLRSGAPLVIYIGGLGGHHTDSSFAAFANVAQSRGYNVLAFSSTMNWSFALSASRSGTPGQTMDDAKDLYVAIEKAIRHVKKKYGYQFGQVGISGFSLGALTSAYIAKLDLEEKRIGIDSLLMVNVPVDVGYGMSVLDSLYSAGESWKGEHKENIGGYAINYYLRSIEALAKKRTTLEEVVRNFGLTTDQIKFVIGRQFRSSLRDALVSSQSVQDLGVLKSKFSRFNQNDRQDEAFRFSFRDYKEKVLLPSWQRRHGANGTVNDMMAHSGLAEVAADIVKLPSVTVIHTEDDFLLRPEDIQFLRDTFGSNLKLYPRGGHGGNLLNVKVTGEMAMALGSLSQRLR